MKPSNSDSFFTKTPSAALAFLTSVAATVVTFAIGVPLEHYDPHSYLAYTLNGIVIAVACFYIVRIHRKSFWYVPFIANAFNILAAVIEPNFWISQMWIPYWMGDNRNCSDCCVESRGKTNFTISTINGAPNQSLPLAGGVQMYRTKCDSKLEIRLRGRF